MFNYKHNIAMKMSYQTVSKDKEIWDRNLKNESNGIFNSDSVGIFNTTQFFFMALKQQTKQATEVKRKWRQMLDLHALQ